MEELHRRAEAGSSIAAAELAIIYSQGRGVFRDSNVAKYWEVRAQAGGFEIDVTAYGDEGEDRKQFWKGLAHQGSILAKAFYVFHMDYETAEKTEQALKLCNEAIAAGYPRGYFRRAFVHRNGDPKNAAQFEKDLLKASELGYIFADEQLAYAYYNARDVERDYDKAYYHANRDGMFLSFPLMAAPGKRAWSCSFLRITYSRLP